jgi:hypothetical protein
VSAWRPEKSAAFTLETTYQLPVVVEPPGDGRRVELGDHLWEVRAQGAEPPALEYEGDRLPTLADTEQALLVEGLQDLEAHRSDPTLVGVERGIVLVPSGPELVLLLPGAQGR